MRTKGTRRRIRERGKTDTHLAGVKDVGELHEREALELALLVLGHGDLQDLAVRLKGFPDVLLRALRYAREE